MFVDWFIVVAQIINFLILVALLRWFLYRPVLSVMAKRKEGIRREWTEVEEIREQARAELDAHQRLREGLEAQKEDWREQARLEVARERRESMEQLRDDLEQQRRCWRSDLERQQTDALDLLRAQLIEQVQTVTRRALADLASVSLEEQIVERFLERLDRLDPARRQALLEELEREGSGARLRTGFPLPAEGRAELRRRLVACFPPLEHGSLAFEQDPLLLCGIELRTPAHVIGWNLDQYLGGLERSLSDALSREPTHALASPGG
jgi:F-type H+-transporting ATPase subunit b